MQGSEARSLEGLPVGLFHHHHHPSGRWPAKRHRWLAAIPAACAALALALALLPSTQFASTPAFASGKTPVKAKASIKIPHVALAQVPWQRHFSHPTPIFIPPMGLPPMSLPWTDFHVMALQISHAGINNRHKGSDPGGHFIMAMCEDKQGNLWLATEGAGVFCYNPSAPKGKRWTQYTKQNTHDTLENNCTYAIACDNHNRIWVGELNHGISVFDGKRWQDYDMVQNPKHHVLAGPLGNHVYAMQFDRYTDQMWICTENGISVYQCARIKPRPVVAPSLVASASHPIPSSHRWHYITQANGLPMNPDSLAFAPNGMVLVGTQCGGLAVGVPVTGSTNNALGWNHYQWTVIKGPWHMPLTATGNGLPGNLVNSVTITSKNHLAVATDEGIALGRYAEQSAMLNGGAVPSALSPAPAASSLNIHLVFEHGQNFVAKVHGLWHPPKHWTAPSGQVLSKLPTEDHTTAVAWEPDKAAGGKAGYLWLGHWRSGLDVWQYNAQGNIIDRWHIRQPQVGNYIQSLQPLRGGAMAVGCYGAGIRIITLPGQSRTAWRTAAKATMQLATTNAHEPHGARPPSARELTAMANTIRQQLIESNGKKQPRIVPLPDDWRTEGNWLGRYGKYWIDLAAVCSPYDFVWGTNESSILYVVSCVYPLAGNEPRYWVQRLQTADWRAPELPAPYMQSREELYHTRPALDRRDASVDDHGEALSSSDQGPGLYVELNVPAGQYVLAIYEWNDDGHASSNRNRDYRLDARRHPYMESFESERRFASEPRDATSRACDFYGGVWKRFLVYGPTQVAIRISRNHSLNTVFSAAALDPMNQYCEPYFASSAPRESTVAYTPHLARPWGAGAGDLASVAKASNRVFRRLDRAQHVSPVAASRWAATYALLAGVYCRCAIRFAGSRSTRRGAVEALAICEWRACQFRRAEELEERLGLVPARRIERSLRWNGMAESQVDEDGDEVRAWRRRHALARPAPAY